MPEDVLPVGMEKGSLEHLFFNTLPVSFDYQRDANLMWAVSRTALASFIDGVTKALKKKDGKLTLVGFGTFSKSHRKARKGRNPQTGETIKIKARNVVKFKVGKKLKDAV